MQQTNKGNGRSTSSGVLCDSEGVFYLDEVEVDPQHQIIRYDGAEVQISEKAMSVLCQLASSSGEVFSRLQLERAAWGSEYAPASGVSNSIRELRDALGDNVHESRYIETVIGRGYRLISNAAPGTTDEAPTGGSQAGLLQNFWQELQQRRVFRVAAAYAIIVWALLQVIDIIFPLLGMPDWVMISVFLIMLLGFPVVLLLAWTFQWDSQGLRYDSPIKLGSPRGFRRLSLATVVLVTGLFSALVWQSYEQFRQLEANDLTHPSTSAADGLIPTGSIAVLRFANIGGRTEDDYFSDGLSEELLNVLARLQELKVASRTSSWSLPADMDIAAIRDRLRVGYVLEGSIRRNGDVVRITAQLIDTRNGYHLWSDTFDRRVEDILKVQDEVASQITDALKILLSDRSRAYLDQSRVTNVEAYDAYLKGLAALRKPIQSEVLEEAERFFLRANDLEPGFSNSWAGLCKSRLARYDFSRSVNDFQQAESACHRTLTLDESSPAVFEALGELYIKSGQLDKAERNYRSALVLAPNSADALMGLGSLLIRTGEQDEAEIYLKQAVALDPGYWKSQNALGAFYFAQGRGQEAVRYFQQLTVLAPDYMIGHNNLGAAYMLTGNFNQAVHAFDAALKLGPDRHAYSNAGSAQFFLRNFDQAAQSYRSAIELAPENYMLWGHLGDALGHAGQTEQAHEAYSRAVALANALRDIDASDPNLQVSLARYYAGLGDKSEALAALALVDRHAADMYVYYDMSLAYIALDDRPAAISALKSALERGYEASLLAQDPGFDLLKNDRQFTTLIEPER